MIIAHKKIPFPSTFLIVKNTGKVSLYRRQFSLNLIKSVYILELIIQHPKIFIYYFMTKWIYFFYFLLLNLFRLWIFFTLQRVEKIDYHCSDFRSVIHVDLIN